MAWVEQSGNHTWRVRYRREDNTIGAINGFVTKAAATDHANTLESDQRQGHFIDPAAGKTTLADWSADWLAALDVAIRTRTSTAACCAATSCPAGGSMAWPTSPGSKPPPGPNNCATRTMRR